MSRGDLKFVLLTFGRFNWLLIGFCDLNRVLLGFIGFGRALLGVLRFTDSHGRVSAVKFFCCAFLFGPAIRDSHFNRSMRCCIESSWCFIFAFSLILSLSHSGGFRFLSSGIGRRPSIRMQMNFGIEIIPPIITALNHIRAGTSLYECVIVIEKNEKKTGLVGFPIERWPRVPHEKKTKKFPLGEFRFGDHEKTRPKRSSNCVFKKNEPERNAGPPFWNVWRCTLDGDRPQLWKLIRWKEKRKGRLCVCVWVCVCVLSALLNVNLKKRNRPPFTQFHISRGE